MAQAEVFMSSLEAFLRERFGERYASVPVVLAGDLNNVPGVDVYRLCPLLDSVLPHAGRIACPCRAVLQCSWRVALPVLVRLEERGVAGAGLRHAFEGILSAVGARTIVLRLCLQYDGVEMVYAVGRCGCTHCGRRRVSLYVQYVLSLTHDESRGLVYTMNTSVLRA